MLKPFFHQSSSLSPPTSSIERDPELYQILSILKGLGNIII
jgi:hypothetical protein